MINLSYNISNIYGNEISNYWINKIPSIVNTIAKKLEIHEIDTLHDLTQNYVARGYIKNVPIIIKISIDFDCLIQEAFALRCLNEAGAPKILFEEEIYDKFLAKHKLSAGFIILERIIPGTPLTSYFPNKETEVVKIACSILKNIAKCKIPAKNNLLHTNNILDLLNKNSEIPSEKLNKAIALSKKLKSINNVYSLVHGDFHHDNILLSSEENENSWHIIDPNAMIGNPLYDVAIFIRNPIKQLTKHYDCHNIIYNRISLFSDLLKINKEIILGWCFLQTIISWLWCLEDNVNYDHCEQFINIIDKYIN